MAEIDNYLKTEIEAKVKAILKLIKDGELDMDGTPEEILKREPLAELVEICEERLKLEVSTIKSIHSEEKRQMHAVFESECYNKIQAPLDLINSQKREVEEQLRAKEHELNTLEQTASGYENQISAYQNEISQLAQKNLDQEDELGKLKKELTTRTKDCSAIQRKLNKVEKDASGEIDALKAKVENLQKDLLSLKTTKEELELNCEKIGEEREKLIEEHAQTLKFFDDENNELAKKTMDLQGTLKEQEDAYQKLNEEYKQVDSKFNECKVNLEVANGKIEEKEEELRESIASKDQIVTDLKHQVEVLKRGLKEKGDETSTLLENVRNHEEQLRLSNQKLRETEQLLSEMEESFRKAEEELQKELRQAQKELEDRNATEVCVDSVKIGIDTLSKKFSDDCNDFDLEKSIANISRELQDVKEHVSEVNSEKEKLQNDNKLLLEELRCIKEHELTLNEKVEKLEIECKNMEAIRKLSLKIVDLTEIASKSGSNC